MGDQRFMSVAQRRRVGAPTTMHDPVGHSPAFAPSRDYMAEAIAGMATVGNPRQPMDRSELAAMVNRSAQSSQGIKVPRQSTASSDPAFFPTARPAPVLQERAGARYGLRVNAPAPVSPEAGPTLANGRLIRGRGVVPGFYGV